MPRTSMTAAHFAARTLCALFVLIPAIAAAQYNTGSIAGLIKHQQSGAVAGAGIVAIHAGAPFTVNLGTDRANIGSGPARRPDATCDANAGGAGSGARRT